MLCKIVLPNFNKLHKAKLLFLVLSLLSIYCCIICVVREVSCFPLTLWVYSVRDKEQQDNNERDAQGDT